MPPSGYSNRQVLPIRQFLESCADDLAHEASAAGRNPVAALEKECQDIDAALAVAAFSPFACDVMRLTRAFYLRIAAEKPSDFEAFRSCLPSVVEALSDEMRAVHIPG